MKKARPEMFTKVTETIPTVEPLGIMLQIASKTHTEIWFARGAKEELANIFFVGGGYLYELTDGLLVYEARMRTECRTLRKKVTRCSLLPRGMPMESHYRTRLGQMQCNLK